MVSDNISFSSLAVGPLETNCYLVWNSATREAVIIDPGSEPERIAAEIERRSLLPRAILNTHGHWDHIGADAEMRRRYTVPLYIHRADEIFLADETFNCAADMGVSFAPITADHLLDGRSTVNLAGMQMTVYHTPGHTPGGICVRTDGLLFTGDTLFCGTVGRADLPGGDENVLEKSLEVFRSLPADLKILPGHGPACTLGKEMKHNPYLR